jgi:hypothetical protein
MSLHEAAQAGDAKRVRDLLDSNVDINQIGPVQSRKTTLS